MTQLEQFKETMTEIGNAFGFSDIQLDELVKYLVKYHNIVTDTEVFLTRFNAIEPIELI